MSRTYHIAMFADERSIHTRRWVLGLRGMGHKVDLITLKKDNTTDIGGIFLGATSKLGYLTKVGALKRKIAELKPDILHSHYASSYGFLASFVDHPRKVLSVWGNDIVEFPKKNKLQHMIIIRSLNKAHSITATSYFLKQVVKNLNNKISDPAVIPFGIDLNQFRYREKNPTDKVTFGIAKSLYPKYGIDYLLQAFAKIAKDKTNVELQIAGRGPYLEKYMLLAGHLNIKNNTKFLGLLPHNAVAEFLSSIDIFIMPSVHDGESFGVAALEAAATGLPVIGTNVGGVPEVIINQQTGFLVNRMDVDQLAQAMQILVCRPDLRKAMGLAGRKLVEERYRWENNLQQMSDLYTQMMT